MSGKLLIYPRVASGVLTNYGVQNWHAAYHSTNDIVRGWGQFHRHLQDGNIVFIYSISLFSIKCL